MRKSRLLLLVLALLFGMVLVACNSGTESTSEEPAPAEEEAAPAEEEAAPAEEEAAPAEEEAAPAEEEAAPAEEEVMGDKVQIRWFVGVGTGSGEEQFEGQQAVVDAFNASHDNIELVLEIVDNASATEVLNTQIAAGNAPDIVGPMGIAGRAAFPGAWLDLEPLIESTGYDLSDFDPAMVDFYLLEGQGQLGLPFGIFPSFIFYNKDLFDEAGLPYPPEEFGAPYVDADGNEMPWDLETLQELSMLLTVDANGNDATSADFDPESAVQFGYGTQWTDLRGRCMMFGADTARFVDADGNAIIPDGFEECVQWYHDAMWTNYFHPNAPYGGSDILSAGNWFDSGNMAMTHVHLWYATCCTGSVSENAQWGIAVMPEVNGQITAKMHADTFAITKNTKHPEEAFEVLTYLIGDAALDLLKVYGGLPARLSLQETYFDELNAGQFAGQDINWQVVIDSMAYPDNPNHEEALPNELEARDRLNAFNQLLDNDPDMDIPAEIEKLQTDLQAIFDAAN